MDSSSFFKGGVGGVFSERHRAQQVEFGISSRYYLDFQEFLEILPFGRSTPQPSELFAKFTSSP